MAELIGEIEEEGKRKRGWFPKGSYRPQLPFLGSPATPRPPSPPTRPIEIEETEKVKRVVG